MRTAEVVIVGAGIVGASIAYHLTAAGCKSVIVMERESAQGKGSTGKSMGGVRAQFSTPVNIQMSLYSIPFYASFDERLGYACGYRAQGYLSAQQASSRWIICGAIMKRKPASA
jgi:sarcosine oxidase, subunit beta